MSSATFVFLAPQHPSCWALPRLNLVERDGLKSPNHNFQRPLTPRLCVCLVEKYSNSSGMNYGKRHQPYFLQIRMKPQKVERDSFLKSLRSVTVVEAQQRLKSCPIWWKKTPAKFEHFNKKSNLILRAFISSGGWSSFSSSP